MVGQSFSVFSSYVNLLIFVNLLRHFRVGAASGDFLLDFNLVLLFRNQADQVSAIFKELFRKHYKTVFGIFSNLLGAATLRH